MIESNFVAPGGMMQTQQGQKQGGSNTLEFDKQTLQKLK